LIRDVGHEIDAVAQVRDPTGQCNRVTSGAHAEPGVTQARPGSGRPLRLARSPLRQAACGGKRSAAAPRNDLRHRSEPLPAVPSGRWSHERTRHAHMRRSVTVPR